MPEERAVDAKGLEALIRKGDVDTVLTVFADGLGRLMGKRVVGRYFLDHVLHEGVHACIYLFTVDMEMEPLSGFKPTSLLLRKNCTPYARESFSVTSAIVASIATCSCGRSSFSKARSIIR